MKTMNTIYTNFAKRFAVVLTLLTFGLTSAWAATETATLDFTKASNCTSIDENKQIWTENGITLTNIKNNSTTPVDNYTPTNDKPARCYKNSKITITHTSNKIAKIVFKCSESNYNISIGSSEKYEVNANGNTTTVTFKEPVASYEQVLTSGQVRLNSIEVIYESAPSTFTVTCKVNEETPWGTLSSTDPISDLASGTSISAEGNVLTIGETEITATLNEADAQYTYAFKEWTWEPAGATITSDVVATATFTRTERRLVNYRTLCTYEIILDKNGGTTDGSALVTASKTALTAINPPVYAGHQIAGYYYEPECNTLVADVEGNLQPNTPYTNANRGWTAGKVTLYPKWEALEYTVTWVVGGDKDKPFATTTASATTPLVLPDPAPANDALGCCADAFIGWSTKTNPTKAEVFNDVANAPEITGNQTFHAVFATTTLTEGSATATFNEMGYANAEKVTEIALGDGEGHGDATILFAKEQSAPNYPAYYTASGALHAYAKNTITINSTSATSTITNVQFTFAAKEDGSNTISANVGTYADGTWSGSAESVVFTIGGETGHRKITSITVTTQAVEQYTNYVTKCTYGNSPTLGAATVTYNSGDGIDVRCEQTSAMNSAATLTFPNAADLTCPITLTASEGFLISTSKSNDAGYQTSLTVSPYKSGSAQAGKLRTIYVRANATGKTENYSGTITISGGEVTEQTIIVNANVNCQGYTLTLKDHLGNTIGTPTSHYEGDIIELPTELEEDACSENYTFDGWSTAPVEYGSLIYNKVSFLYTMPAKDVTLYPVYQCNKTEDYHRVTSDLGANNWAGDYLIAAEKNGVCHFANGAAENIGVAESEKVLSVNDNIVSATEGDQYFVKLIAVDYGYILQSKSEKYNYINENDNSGLSGTGNISTAMSHPLTVAFDGGTKTVSIANMMHKNNAALQYTDFSKCFRFYTPGNQTPIYLYKKSPLYTSYLACGTIDVTGNEVYVTATQNRGVMAPEVLTVTAEGMYPNANVILTSNSSDVYFSIDRTANFEKVDLNKPKTSLPLNADADGKLQQDIYVHYKPGTTGNGVPADVVVTAKSDNLPISDDQTIHVRNLPAQFVIATKVGSHWYALPADMSAATNPEGVLIKVDETEMRAEAPTSTVYTLWPVKTTATENDRYTNATGEAYGDRVRFGAVNYGQRGLWANNNKDDNTIRNYAVIDALGADGLAGYEWKITTTVVDGNWQYTLQTDQQNNTNYLRYWTAATGAPKWGTYAAGNNQLYFLPVTETEPFDYKVVEWYPTKMLIQTDAAIANPTAKIGDEQFNDITCTNKGSKLYEIAGLPLESNPTKVLTINFNDYTCAKAIPVIISRSITNVSGTTFTTLTKDVYNYADLVVRDGATLTIDGGTHAENTFFNVTIYPTSKISVPSDKKLTVHSLTFFGGIDEIYNGSTTYTLNKYGVPELSLKGTLKKSISTIDYLMRVDSKQMYSLTVPYDVQLADIKYWDGTNIVLGNELWVSAYDGASRAQNQGNGKNWIYETDFESKLGAATLKAGVGYTISAELQSGVGNEYSILRMPMNSNVVNEASEVAKSVAVTAHGIDANITDNHKGWNLVGNPYMASITGADDNHLVLGYLQETGTGPWEWVEKTYRYVTIPSDDGTYYWQEKFTDVVLPPFKNFFVQVGTTGELVFDLGTRQSMPARYLQQEQAPREVEFELLLSNEAQSDNMGLLISEEYTPAYEINADLEKMIGNMSVYSIYNGYQLAYTALSPLNAMEEIPLGYVLPSTGEYTFALDEHGDLDDIEHIYLLDYDKNTTTDLMEDIYTFAATEKKSDKRFAISVILKEEEEVETPTQLETLEWESDRPCKFIFHDQMYILRNGVIYDAMGKQVQTINK